MAAQILFSETQRFKQWWLWLMLLVASCFPVFGFFRELQNTAPFSNPEKNTGIIISLIVMGAVIALFFLLRLETKITDTGISVRYTPFHFKFQEYGWAEIEQIYVRNYSPLGEFGGWGLRYGMDGKAYNVAGDQGIQIVLKNGKKLLIGTQKPEEATKALEQAQTLVR